MARQADEPLSIEASSGNVFVDLGLRDAEALDAKVRLAVKINELLAAPQAQLVALLEASQPQISMIKNYRLEGFSTDWLIGFLRALEQDAE